MTQGQRRTLCLGVVVFVMPVVWIFAAEAAKAASAPNLNQPVRLSAVQAPAFYEYGEKVTYQFTITSISQQTQYLHVYVESYADPAKVFATSSITRYYTLLPGQSITVTFKAYAPTNDVFDNAELNMGAMVSAEGYPFQTIGAHIEHDSGK